MKSKKFLLVTVVITFTSTLFSISSHSQKPLSTEKQILYKAKLREFITAIKLKVADVVVQPDFYKKYLFISGEFADSTTEQGKDYYLFVPDVITRVREHFLKNEIDDYELASLEHFSKDTTINNFFIDEKLQKYLKNIKEEVMVCYKKSNPQKPLYLIRFHKETNKLYTWLVLENNWSILFFLYPEKPSI